MRPPGRGPYPHLLDDYRGEFGYGVAPEKIENTGLTDPFAEIRPYRDDEVAAVLSRLLDNVEFLDTLAAVSFRGEDVAF